MTIRHVISFDADNCLFHRGYVWHPLDPHHDENEVITKNRHLFDAIKAERHLYAEEIVFCGSNRQDEYWDRVLQADKNPTESFFIALQKVCKELDARLDAFLLADVYSELPDGSAYAQAVNNRISSDMTASPRWRFDKSKLTILYAQIHKIANEYPEDDVVFDFYDDKAFGILNNFLLEELYTFFITYPDLLPDRTTLRLKYYEGKDVKDIGIIQGKGSIDRAYRQTILDMMTLVQNKDRREKKDVLRHLDVSNVRLCRSVYQTQAPQRFFNAQQHVAPQQASHSQASCEDFLDKLHP